MSVIAIIQARMSSSRLPGKVLMPLGGKPVLAHILDRLSLCVLVKDVVVATSDDPSDRPVEEFCDQKGIKCFKGSLSDVLDRFHQTAKFYDADDILRITGDCPLIDPIVIDSIISSYYCGAYDLYGLSGDFPDGLDCTVIAREALDRAWREAVLDSEREHVCPYIEKNKDIFKVGGLEMFSQLGSVRLTLDEEADYLLLEEIFNNLGHIRPIFRTHDVLDFLRKNPDLAELNTYIPRNQGYKKSLERDREKL